MRHVAPLHELARRFADATDSSQPDRLAPEWGGVDARILIVHDQWYGSDDRAAEESAAFGLPLQGYLWEGVLTVDRGKHAFPEAFRLAQLPPSACSLWNSVPATIGDTDVRTEALAVKYLAGAIALHQDCVVVVSLGANARSRTEKALARHGYRNRIKHESGAPSYGKRAQSSEAAREAGGHAEAIARHLTAALDYAYPLGVM